MRYWVAYRECGCVLAVAPETASMIPQGADCEFVRLAVARGLKTRLTAEGEQAPTVGPCPKHRADCPDCGGHGWYQSEFRSDAGDTCRTCNGTGIIATASAEPLAARQEEKPGNEAAETPEAPLEAGERQEIVGTMELAGKTFPLYGVKESPPSGAGESERRDMGTITVQPIIYEDGKALTRLAPETGHYIVLEQAFKNAEEAALGLRALADALDGGPKRKKKAKCE